ncbi:MAG: hypothetical protein HZC17_00200 [Candidatus Omnitrophica bacterium]|nr:hypothetical protein [Candidatus Omnitrophota bacterium]
MKIKKWISGLLIFFFFTNSVFAQVPLAVSPAANILDLKSPIADVQIPAELGTVAHRSQGAGPMVIHVSDAHANYEAQLHIKNILDYLIRMHSVRLVGLEGACAKLRPEIFRLFLDEKVNSAVVDSLVKDGELTGAEFLAIENASKNAPVWTGVEDKNLYLADLAAFRRVHETYESQKDYFEKEKIEIAKLKARVFSEELRKFDAAKYQFEDRRSSFIDYGRALQKAASRYLKLDLTNPKEQKEFSNLVRIAILSRIETDVRKQADQIEKEKSALRSKLGGFDWTTQSPNRRFFETLYGASRKNKVDLNQFPAFKQWAEYEILKSEIDAPALFEEIARLETKLYGALIHTSEERALVSRSENLRLTEKFVRLEVTRQEYEAFHFSGDKQIELLVREAQQFYDLAIKRDSALITNLLKIAREKKLSKVVLVTGGFHSSGISEILKNQQISHITVTPKITSEDKSGNYLRVILDKLSSPLVTGDVATPARIAKLVNLANARGARLLKAASLGEQLSQKPKVSTVDFVVGDSVQGKSLGGVSEVFDFLSQHPAALVAATGIVFAATSIFCISYLDRYRVIDGFEFANNKERTMAKNGLNKLRWALKAAGIAPESVFESGLFQTVFMARDLSELMLYLDFGIKLSEMGVNPNPAYFHVIPQLSHRVQQYRGDLAKMLKILQDTALELKKSGVSNTAIEDIFTNQISRIISEKPSINSMVEAIRKVGRPVSGNSLGKKRPIKYQEFLELPTYIDPEEVMGYRQMNSAGVFFDPVMPLRFYPTFRQSAFSGLDVKNFLKFLEPDEKPVAYGIFRYFMAPSWPALIHHCFFLEDGRLVVICKNFGHEVYKIVQASGPGTRSNPKKDDRGELDERARELLTLNASVIQQYKDWKLIKVSASSLGTRGHRSRGLRDQRKALNNRLIEHHLFHFSSNNWGNKKNSLMVLAQWVQRWPEKFTQRHLDRIRALLADNNENVREQAALTIQEFRKYRHDLFLRGDFAVKGSVYERAQKNGDSTTASSLGRDAGVHRTTIYGDFEHEKELTKISNEHVRNWVRSAAQFLGAKSLEIVDESYRERLLGAEDAANDYVWLSGNPLTGLAGTRHFSGELTDTMKASIKNALNGKELYVIPYFAEKSEGAPAQSGVLLSDDLHVVTQMLLMPHIVVGNAAAERLKTSKHFEKSISLSSASSLGETTEISRQAFEAFLNKHEFGWMTYSHVGFMNGIAPGSPVRVSELSTGIRASVPYIYVIADKNTSGDEIIRALYHSGIIKQPKFQPIRKDLEQFLAREAPKLLAETVFSKIGITDIKKMIAEKGFRETIFENRDSKPAVWVRLTESGESGEAVVVSRERVGNNNRVLGYRLDILFGYYATGEDIVREVLRSNEIRDLNFAPVRRAFEDLARVKAPQLFEFVQGASLGERTKPVKVVVLDLKGTLLDNSGNLIKGVPEIINRLKQRKDLRLVVFTNAKPATIFQVQIKFPLFDGIAFISASELGYSKPSAEAYRELANKLNQKYGVKFDDEVLVVDDEEVNLEAPRGLGWRTVHLTPEQHLNAQPLIQDLLNNVEKPAAGSSLGESAESKIPVQDIQAIIKRESLIELIFGGAILGTSVMIFLTPVLAFEEGVAFNTLLGLTAGISFYGAASWFLGNVLAKPESWGNISRLISQEKFKDVDWGVLFRKADELRRTLILRGIKPGFAFRSLERAIIDVRSGKELLSLLNYGVDIAEKGGEPALIFQVAEYRQKGSAASLGNAGSWDSTANPQISKEDIERVLKARNVQIFWQKTPGERIRFMYSQPPFVLAGKDATPGDVVREILLLPIPSKDEFAVYYSEIQKDIEAFVASKAPGILVRVFVEKEEDARFDSSWRGLESKFKAAGVEYAEILGSAYESVFMQKERVTFMRVMDDRRSNNVEVKLSDFSGVSLDDQIVKVRLSRRTDPAEAIRGALANNDLPKSAREKLSRLSKAITGASLGDEKLSNGEVMVAGVVVSIITVALAVIGVGLLTVGAAFAVVGIPVFGVTLGVFYLGALAHDFFFTNGSFFQRQSLLNAFSFKNRSERSVIDRKLNILRNELVKRDKKNRILFAGNSFTETEEHFRYHVPDLLKKARSASELEAFLDSWIRFAKADKLPWMTFRDYVEQDFLSFSPEVSDTVEYLDKFIDLIFYFLSISKNEYDIVPQLIHRQGYPRNVKEYVGALGLVADFAGRLKEKGISLYTPLHEGVFQILETVKSSEELSSTLDAFGDFVLKLYRSLTPDNADSVLIWSRVDVSRNEKKNIYTKETLELLEALVAHPNFVRAAEDYNWRWIPWDKLLGQLKQIKQRGNSFDVEYRVEGNGGVRTKSIELVETKAQSLGNGKSDAQENAGVLEALERRFEGKKLLRELLGQIVKSKTYWDIRKFTKRIGAKLQPQMGDDLALTPDSDGTVRFQFEGVSIPLKTGDVVIKKTDDPIRTVDNIFYFIHSTPDPTALSSAVQVTFKQIHTGAQFDVLVDREHGLNRPAYFILATAREIELLRKQGFESSGVHGLSLGASEPIRFGLSAENEAKAQAIWKEIMKANGSEAKATLQKIQRLKSFWSSLNELPLIIDIVAANLHTELGASDNQQYSIAIQIYSDVIKKAEKAGTSAIAQLGVALTSRGYAYFQLGKTELAQQDMERGLQITLGSSLGESAESKNSLQVPAVAPVPYDPIKELMKGYEQEPVSVKRTGIIFMAPREKMFWPQALAKIL